MTPQHDISRVDSLDHEIRSPFQALGQWGRSESSAGPASNERGLVEKEGRSTCPLSLPNHARRSYPAAIRSSPLTESLERATRFVNIVIGDKSDAEWF